MKITLGTVQFGIQYGISNAHGVPSDSELESIFSVASKRASVDLCDCGAIGETTGFLREFFTLKVYHRFRAFPLIFQRILWVR